MGYLTRNIIFILLAFFIINALSSLAAGQATMKLFKKITHFISPTRMLDKATLSQLPKL